MALSPQEFLQGAVAGATAAKAATTGQAPKSSQAGSQGPPKAATDLVKELIAQKEGKPKETLKSKLTDSDTLFRFAAGLAAALSGEGAAGAAIAGTGLLNASNEASNANKANEAAIEDLKLKEIDLARQRENQLITAGFANPELVANMPEYKGLVGDETLGTSIYNSASRMQETARAKQEASTLLSMLPEMDNEEQRRNTITRATRTLGYRMSDEEIADIAKQGLSSQHLLNIAAQATPKSSIKAWEWWSANPNDPDRDQKFINMLDPLNPPRTGSTEADVKFKILEDRNKILAKVFAAVEANPDKFSSAYIALYDKNVLTDAERSFFLTSDNSFDLNTLKSPTQQVFDQKEYLRLVDEATARIEQNNILYANNGETDKVIPTSQIGAAASSFAIKAMTSSAQAQFGIKQDRSVATLGFVRKVVMGNLGLPDDYQDTSGVLAGAIGVELREASNAVRASNPELSGADLDNAITDYIANKFRGDNPAGATTPKADTSSKDDKIKGILEKHKDLDFVKRILKPGKSPHLTDESGAKMTHKMAWSEQDGKFIVYPTIVRVGGKLKQLDDKAAIDYANTTGEYIAFGTAEEADWFSKEYKSVWENTGWKNLGAGLKKATDATGAALKDVVEAPGEMKDIFTQ